VRFDYGEEAILKMKNEAGNVIEKECWIVSITPVETDEQANHFKHPVGTVLYTVEFADGSDTFVPEWDLRRRD